MDQGRRLSRRRTPLVLGLIGLVMIGSGVGIAVDTEGRCHGRPMASNEACDRNFIPNPGLRDGASQPEVALTKRYERQRRTLRSLGWLLAAVGGVLVFGSRELSRQEKRHAQARERHARQRAAVAIAQGWSYRGQDQSITHAWQYEHLLAAPPVAWDVLSGTENGQPFQLFDVEDPPNEALNVLAEVCRFTVCAVPLSFTPPLLQVIVAQEHVAHLRMVWQSPTDLDLVTPDGTFDWAVAVRTEEEAETTARRLLTPAVVAHIRAHELSFVLLGPWLSVTVPLVEDPAALVPLVQASTQLAAMLPTGEPEADPAPDLGAVLNRAWNWLRKQLGS